MDSYAPRPPGIGKKKNEIARGTPPKAGPPRAAKKAPSDHLITARLLDHATGKPLSGIAYEVVDAKGKVVASGQTDYTGTVHHDVPAPGKYHVRRAASPLPRKRADQTEEAVYAIVDHATDQPLAGVHYSILDELGNVVASGTTDHRGIAKAKLKSAGPHHVRLHGQEGKGGADA